MTEATTFPQPSEDEQMCWFNSHGLFPWWVILLWGILAFLIGVMFLASPGITTLVFVTFLGAYWLVSGIFALISLAIDRTDMGWKIFLAVLNLIAGIIILSYPLYSTVFLLAFLVIFIGFWACFTGFVHLFHAFTRKDAGNGIIGIISIIFGILLLVFPLLSAALLPFVAGIFALLIGIVAIFAALQVKKGIPAAAAA